MNNKQDESGRDNPQRLMLYVHQMNGKQEELVQRLLEKTQAQTVTWEETSLEGQYALNLQSATILIDSKPPIQSPLMYQMRILDSEGQVVQDITALKASRAYTLLKSLYQVVNSSGTLVDQVLNELKTTTEVAS